MILSLTNKTTKAIVALHFSHFLWYSCGSRFFGDAEPGSDFDFFTEDGQEVRSWLQANGGLFKERKLDKHHDVNTVAIYGVRGKEIHVILVKSVEARVKAQELARSYSKADRKLIPTWDKIYNEIGLD